MTSFRKTALAGGLLYLLTFIGSIPAAILVAPALEPGYVTGAGMDTQIALGAIGELMNVFGCFFCGVAFFAVIRRVHEGLAIGYFATRMFEAATIAVGVLCVLAVVTLRQQGAADGGAQALSPVADALVAVRHWAMVIGSNMAPWNALMLGTALYRARLVPRAIPALGLVGAPLLIAFVIGNILGIAQPGTIFHAVAVFPFFTWELVLGLWLTFKGFNESSPIAIAERAERAAMTGTTSSRVAVAAEAGAA
ncbi:MAG TPA: DUF4386 domain-containing protein [Candidatus Limnocylindrales bacterium]|nr:DUF4386 domain-containing protein [Candidatus Limnocylindrales bacterium]